MRIHTVRSFLTLLLFRLIYILMDVSFCNFLSKTSINGRSPHSVRIRYLCGNNKAYNATSHFQFKDYNAKLADAKPSIIEVIQ